MQKDEGGQEESSEGSFKLRRKPKEKQDFFLDVHEGF